METPLKHCRTALGGLQCSLGRHLGPRMIRVLVIRLELLVASGGCLLNRLSISHTCWNLFYQHLCQHTPEPESSPNRGLFLRACSSFLKIPTFDIFNEHLNFFTHHSIKTQLVFHFLLIFLFLKGFHKVKSSDFRLAGPQKSLAEYFNSGPGFSEPRAHLLWDES